MFLHYYYCYWLISYHAGKCMHRPNNVCWLNLIELPRSYYEATLQLLQITQIEISTQ